MSMSVKSMSLVVIAACLLMAGLSSCGRTELSDTEYLTRAEDHLSKGELQAAIIELKNALQKNPKNSEARLRLGESYLSIGNGPAAEKELRRAIQLGEQGADVTVLLARALLMQDKHRELIDFSAEAAGAGQGGMKAEILVLQGKAYMGEGQTEKAAAALRDALDVQDAFVPALLGLAQLAMMEQSMERAVKRVDEAVEIDPQSAEAWQVKGQVALAQERYPEAEQFFDKALSLLATPRDAYERALVRMDLIKAQLAQNHHEDALSNIESLKKGGYRHPVLKYYQGMIAYREKKYGAAQDFFIQVENALPDFPENLLMMGSTYLARNLPEQAEQYLSRYVNAVPGNVAGVKLLARARMELGQWLSAFELLQSVVVEDTDDAQLLAMAGNAALRGGDYRQGALYLRKASELDPQNRGIRDRLAIAYLDSGDTGQAVKELESMVGPAQADFRSTAMLVIAYIRDGNFEKAEQAARNLIAEFPDDPKGYGLLGGFYAITGRDESAREQLRKSLELDSGFVPGMLALAAIGQRTGDPATAREYYEQALSHDEENVDAMVGLALVEDRAGEQTQAIDWLKKARAAEPDALAPTYLLARYYLNKGENASARDLSSGLVNLYPSRPQVLDLHGRVLLQGGDAEGAVAVYEKLVEMQPDVSAVHFRLGQALLASEDLQRARAALNDALEVGPESTPALALLTTLDVRSGDTERARRRLSEYMKAHPASHLGRVLTGDVAMLTESYGQAVEAYEAALSSAGNTALFLKYHRALSLDGQTDKAMSELDAWVDAHPDDVAALLAAAAAKYGLGDTKAAMMHYRQVLERDDSNLVALNNLAWLRYEQSQDPVALELAERAYRVAPERTEALDTYGWLLVQEGRLDEGAPLLRKAFENAPDEPEIGYHLAFALAKTGAQQEARRLIDDMLASEKDFPSRQAAVELLEDL